MIPAIQVNLKVFNAISIHHIIHSLNEYYGVGLGIFSPKGDKQNFILEVHSYSHSRYDSIELGRKWLAKFLSQSALEFQEIDITEMI